MHEIDKTFCQMMRVTSFGVKQLGWPATGPEGEADAPADAGLAIDGNRRTADCAITGCRVHKSSDEAIGLLLTPTTEPSPRQESSVRSRCRAPTDFTEMHSLSTLLKSAVHPRRPRRSASAPHTRTKRPAATLATILFVPLSRQHGPIPIHTNRTNGWA